VSDIGIVRFRRIFGESRVAELRDYYTILAVSPDADHADIKTGYERLSRIYQPDADAEPVDPERMRALDEAFDVLDDPSQRAAYDRARRESPHDGARTIAAWLGGIAWFILVAGVIGAVGVGIVGSVTCETSFINESCSDEVGAAWGVAAAAGIYSVVFAVIFFAARHVVLLLIEIAEKE